VVAIMGDLMAATDHLSGAQFMPIEKVGQMRSGNFPGMTVEEEYQARMRGEAPQRQNDDARARHHGFRDASDYQAAITGSIRTRGMVNAPSSATTRSGMTIARTTTAPAPRP
jgi:hypothetical protein